MSDIQENILGIIKNRCEKSRTFHLNEQLDSDAVHIAQRESYYEN